LIGSATIPKFIYENSQGIKNINAKDGIDQFFEDSGVFHRLDLEYVEDDDDILSNDSFIG